MSARGCRGSWLWARRGLVGAHHHDHAGRAGERAGARFERLDVAHREWPRCCSSLETRCARPVVSVSLSTATVVSAAGVVRAAGAVAAAWCLAWTCFFATAVPAAACVALLVLFPPEDPSDMTAMIRPA